MTDRLIVATFNDTNSAYDAASAIKNLKDSGLAEFKPKAGVMVKTGIARSSGQPWVLRPAL
jgi:acetyl-CoA carboxylase carboxyltransferase component